MKSVSSLALGAALVVGASLLVSAPAEAQSSRGKQAQPAATATPGARQFTFSKEERTALLPLQNAVKAKDWAAANAALPAARAAATGNDARYVISQFELTIGQETQDMAMQSRAIDALIASGGLPATELPAYLQNQGTLALNAGDRVKAEAAFTRLAEIAPNNAEAFVNLARIKNDLRKPQEAVQMMDRAIAMRKAAGQPADETWYKYALKMAYDGKMAPQALKMARELVTAYPTEPNWRDALLIYREMTPMDKETSLDTLRLMRAVKSLSGERDWYELAEGLERGGFPGEAKAVLEEGVSRRMIDGAKPAFRDLLRLATTRAQGDRAAVMGSVAGALAGPSTRALTTANALFGYGEYARAAELYRAALTKGGIDANLANTRLGMSLALAGDRTGAETAFRAVTGPRSELAAYWLLWLSRRA